MKNLQFKFIVTKALYYNKLATYAFMVLGLFSLTAINESSAKTWLVTSTGNSGSGTLRTLIVDSASAGDTITFHASIDGDTIFITSGEIVIDKDLVIIGNGTANTIIDGSNNSRIFETSSSTNPTLSIHQLTIQDGYSTGNGGGILHNSYQMLTIDHCLISKDSVFSGQQGGGIYTNDGNVTISNSVISGNFAYGGGGGIYSEDGHILIMNSSIRGNLTYGGGGGINCNGLSAVVTVIQSTISGNTSAGPGGGIYNEYNDLTITNSTISANTAYNDGGGIFNEYPSVLILNSTITKNNAYAGSGGGIYTYGGFGAKFTMHNSIVAGNSASGSAPDGYHYGGGGGVIDNSNSYNLVGDSTGFGMPGGNHNQLGSSGSPIDPRLGPLADNGGPTQTHALLCGSPAFNMGNTDSLTDQRGESRGAFGADDIGAFESQTNTTLTVTNSNDSGPGSLRQTILDACAGDTILFDASTNGDTIFLTTGDIVISKNLVIIGNGPSSTIIDGSNNSRIFESQSSSVITIQLLTIQNGYDIFNGGGVFNRNGCTLRIDQCSFTGNSSIGTGGGIGNEGTITIKNTTFRGNTSGSGGGFANYGTATIINSTFSENNGTFKGGGVYNDSTTSSDQGMVTILNSTISGNSSSGGGGIVMDHGKLVIHNSIIAGNSGGSLPDGKIIGGTIDASSSYNLVGDTSNFPMPSGNHNLLGNTANPIDPNLGPLADNGGPTQTMALLCGSPAYNTGNTDSLTDQRGESRGAFGADDIGAFESQTNVMPGATLTVTNSNDAGPGSLRQTILDACAGDTILFDAATDGDSIVLTSGEILIDKKLVIIGNGPANTIIDGNHSSRIFETSPSTNPAVTIRQLTIQNGFVSGGYGGGIFQNSQDTLIIDHCTINKNSASSGFGGGLMNLYGAVIIMNSTISGNSAINGYGGGIYSTYGSATMTITNSTVSGNTAYLSGGVYNGLGMSLITNSTISGNSANIGGGFYNDQGTATINNCTISGDSADYGGGIFLNAGTVTLTNSTISGDSAFEGGGIDINHGGTAIFHNTIIAGNIVSGAGKDGYRRTGATINGTSSYNLVGDTSNFPMPGGNNNLLGNTVNPIDPHLGPLADNGGPTKTMALLCGSPAYNMGNTDSLIDQRGESRGAFGADDIGAFESQTDLTAPGTFVVYNTNDAGPGSLRQLLADASSGDTIWFCPSTNGDTIHLTSLAIHLDKNLVIIGNGMDNTIISADYNSRIFFSTANVSISDLSVVKGKNNIGGGIYNTGNLTLLRCRFWKNEATVFAGAIGNFSSGNDASFTADQCKFIENFGAPEAAAIGNANFSTNTVRVYISNSLFEGNQVGAHGGTIKSISQYNGTIRDSIINCVIRNNTGENSAGYLNFSNSGSVNTFISGSTFRGNTATGKSGAMFFSQPATVVNTVIDSNSANNGAGIFNNSTVTFTNCTIDSNSADSSGGGIWNTPNGALTITGGSIAHNTASGNSVGQGGGGIFNNGGMVSINNIFAFNYNQANGTSGSGGGIFSNGGTVNLSVAFVSQNSANRSGGGMEIKNGTLNFNAVSLNGNDVNGVAGTPNPGMGGGLFASGNSIVHLSTLVLSDNKAALQGGGIWNDAGSTINLVNVDLRNNVAHGSATTDGGGGIYNEGTMTIYQSSVNNNDADGTNAWGGGLYNLSGGTVTISNSTVSDNASKGSGGGIYNSGSLALESATIANNETGNNGGGLAQGAIIAAHTVFHNTIVATNTAANNGLDVYKGVGSFTSNDYNLIGEDDQNHFTAQTNDLVGTSASPIDPKLGLLTTSHTPWHPLLCGSPAINSGEADSTTDQHSQARNFGGQDDRGAFELQISCVNCANGKALCLDGDNDHVKVDADPSLNITNNFTFEGWICSNEKRYWQTIFEYNSGSQIGVHFYLRAKGNFTKLYANLVDINGHSHAYETVDTVYWIDTCIHVALTRCNDTVKFYVNGVYYKAVNVGWGGPIGNNKLATSFDLYFGARPQNGNIFEFKGSYDDFRLWNYCRSQSQINHDKDYEMNGNEPGLAGYWNFNNPSTTTAFDSSPNGNDGHIVDAQKCDKCCGPKYDPQPLPHRVLCMDGDDDYVYVPANSALDVKNNFTIEAWGKPGDKLYWQSIVEYNNGNNNQGVHLYFRWKNKGAVRTIHANLIDRVGRSHWYRTPVNTQVWTPDKCYHVALTRCADTVYIYVNGVKYSTDNYLGGPIGTQMVQTSFDLYFGARINNNRPIFELNGYIDEVRIWDICRTEAQIQANMNVELNGTQGHLVGLWNFNNSSTTTAYDITAYGNDGTLMDDAVKTPGVFCPEGADKRGLLAVENKKDDNSSNGDVMLRGFPNPFSNNTTISYTLPNDIQVTLKVYDLNGRVAKELVNGYKLKGTHTINWNGTGINGDLLSGGIYIIKMVTGGKVSTQTLMMAR